MAAATDAVKRGPQLLRDTHGTSPARSSFPTLMIGWRRRSAARPSLARVISFSSERIRLFALPIPRRRPRSASSSYAPSSALNCYRYA
jgi:hypothetical protein